MATYSISSSRGLKKYCTLLDKKEWRGEEGTGVGRSGRGSARRKNRWLIGRGMVEDAEGAKTSGRACGRENKKKE